MIEAAPKRPRGESEGSCVTSPNYDTQPSWKWAKFGMATHTTSLTLTAISLQGTSTLPPNIQSCTQDAIVQIGFCQPTLAHITQISLVAQTPFAWVNSVINGVPVGTSFWIPGSVQLYVWAAISDIGMPYAENIVSTQRMAVEIQADNTVSTSMQAVNGFFYCGSPQLFSGNLKSAVLSSTRLPKNVGQGQAYYRVKMALGPDVSGAFGTYSVTVEPSAFAGKRQCFVRAKGANVLHDRTSDIGTYELQDEVPYYAIPWVNNAAYTSAHVFAKYERLGANPVTVVVKPNEETYGGFRSKSCCRLMWLGVLVTLKDDAVVDSPCAFDLKWKCVRGIGAFVYKGLNVKLLIATECAQLVIPP
jgi:hypothetical protein